MVEYVGWKMCVGKVMYFTKSSKVAWVGFCYTGATRLVF